MYHIIVVIDREEKRFPKRCILYSLKNFLWKRSSILSFPAVYSAPIFSKPLSIKNYFMWSDGFSLPLRGKTIF